MLGDLLLIALNAPAKFVEVTAEAWQKARPFAEYLVITSPTWIAFFSEA